MAVVPRSLKCSLISTARALRAIFHGVDLSDFALRYLYVADVDTSSAELALGEGITEVQHLIGISVAGKKV